jgi:hypothetical protein
VNNTLVSKFTIINITRNIKNIQEHNKKFDYNYSNEEKNYYS